MLAERVVVWRWVQAQGLQAGLTARWH